MHTKMKSATVISKVIAVVMIVLISLSFLSTQSFAAETTNTPDKDITNNNDSGKDKVDGQTIGGGGSHTAAGTGGAEKGDEGFRLYLIDASGAVVSKVVDFYYPDVPNIPFKKPTGDFCHNVVYTKQDGILRQNSLKGMKSNKVMINKVENNCDLRKEAGISLAQLQCAVKRWFAALKKATVSECTKVVVRHIASKT